MVVVDTAVIGVIAIGSALVDAVNVVMGVARNRVTTMEVVATIVTTTTIVVINALTVEMEDARNIMTVVTTTVVMTTVITTTVIMTGTMAMTIGVTAATVTATVAATAVADMMGMVGTIGISH